MLFRSDWTIATDVSWLTLSSTSGTGATTITITAQSNSGTVTRTAIISISSILKSSPLEITITQYADGTTSITENNNDDINVWPNPTSNYISYSSIKDLKQINIIDTRGLLIESIYPIDSRISFESFIDGVYWIEFVSKNGTVIYKRIIKK